MSGKIPDEQEKIIEHYIYKKIRHKNKNNEEEINIDKENPLEKYIESEEMIHLPEEIDTKVEGNLTTYTHKFYKQMKFIDKNSKETFGEKILLFNTSFSLKYEKHDINTSSFIRAYSIFPFS